MSNQQQVAERNNQAVEDVQTLKKQFTALLTAVDDLESRVSSLESAERMRQTEL